MVLRVLEEAFTVCTVEDYSQAPLEDDFCFVGKTDEERSLVCATAHLPGNTLRREDGWRAFRVEGELDFSLVGILAEIAGVLAGAGVSLFALSTYRTDYLLLKAEGFEKGLKALEGAGFEVLRG